MSDSTRRPGGLGIAARFTLGLGLLASVFAAAAAMLLLKGIDSIEDDVVRAAQAEVAAETSRLEAYDARRGTMTMKSVDVGGTTVQVGEGPIESIDGTTAARVMLVSSPAVGDQPGTTRTFFARPMGEFDTASRILILIVLACGGLAAAVVMMGALTARRLAAPLNEMVEDVMAISRGRLDRRIRGGDAVREVAHLSIAMERMVDDLVESRSTEEALAESKAEEENLRELRRHLAPMPIDPPAGWLVETLLLEAEGAGSGDFVDAMQDADGRLITVVGVPAAEGMPGALLMAMSRAYLRSGLLGGAEPAVACDAANTSLHRDLLRGLYCAVSVAAAQPDTGEVTLVSAGLQAPAVRFDAAAGQLRKLQPNGIALGFDKGPIFRSSLESMNLSLAPGDALFLFSPEAFACESAAGRELGESGVYQLAKIAIAEGMDAMEAKLTAFLGGAPSADLAFTLLRRDA